MSKPADSDVNVPPTGNPGNRLSLGYLFAAIDSLHIRSFSRPALSRESRFLFFWTYAGGLIALTLIGGQSASAQSVYEPYKFSTLAGNSPGSVDGAGNIARFNGPFGTAADGSGNIYVADSDN